MSAFETLQEWETYEMEGPGHGELEYGELEWESEGAYESQEQEGEFFGEFESPLGEVQEMELATELLEVSSEAELEQFLGGLIKSVGRVAGRALRSPVGRALGGALKGIARRALPHVAGIAGNFLLPGVGGLAGRALGTWASRLFEFEFEGMNEQEAEFEMARRFVRFASTAAQNAADAPQNAPPRSVARAAVVSAARQHMPGLLRGHRPGAPGGRPGRRRRSGYPAGGVYHSGSCDCPPNGAGAAEPGQPAGGGGGAEHAPGQDHPSGRPQSGRWIRRGRKIVLFGV